MLPSRLSGKCLCRMSPPAVVPQVLPNTRLKLSSVYYKANLIRTWKAKKTWLILIFAALKCWITIQDKCDYGKSALAVTSWPPGSVHVEEAGLCVIYKTRPRSEILKRLMGLVPVRIYLIIVFIIMIINSSRAISLSLIAGCCQCQHHVKALS